jgi:hypothetical protein
MVESILYLSLVLFSLVAIFLWLHLATPALGDSVPLLKIKTDNSTLKHELPIPISKLNLR